MIHNALYNRTPILASTDNTPFCMQVAKHSRLTTCTCLTCSNMNSDCHMHMPLAGAAFSFACIPHLEQLQTEQYHCKT